MKHGAGEERTILGTVFKGHWERGRKHGSGQRKIAYGLTEDQVSVYYQKIMMTIFTL